MRFWTSFKLPIASLKRNTVFIKVFKDFNYFFTYKATLLSLRYIIPIYSMLLKQHLLLFVRTYTMQFLMTEFRLRKHRDTVAFTVKQSPIEIIADICL